MATNPKASFKKFISESSDLTSANRTSTRLDVAGSIEYAKITCDYLSGQAASVLLMVEDINRQKSVTLAESRLLVTLRMLAESLQALKEARESLLKDFWEFEGDALAWVAYLESGGGTDGPSKKYVKEANEIEDALDRAREQVKEGCGEVWKE